MGNKIGLHVLPLACLRFRRVVARYYFSVIFSKRQFDYRVYHFTIISSSD